MNRNRILCSLLVLAALCGAPALRAQDVTAGAVGSAQLLTGSWLTQVTPDPASGVGPFRQLITFNADGTMVEIDDGAPGPPFPTGPGQGVWRKTRSGAFNYTYLNLIYDPSTFASNGELKIRGLLMFDHDPDHFAGQDKATGYDKNGNVVFTSTASVTGTRILNEPF
jgi:hypothetical protein